MVVYIYFAAGQLLSGQPVQYVRGRQYSPSITYKITPAWLLFSSQPGGLPSWAGHYLQLSSSPSALLLVFWSLIWLNDLSSIKLAFNIKDQKPKLGQALIGFSPLKFLPVRNAEAQVAWYFDFNRAECSTELATSESGWNPRWGGAKTDKVGSHHYLDIFKAFERKTACSMTVPNATST
jgi:hypothetical protein